MSEAVTVVKTQVVDGQYKDIDTLKYEINSLYHQTQETMLISAIKLGRKLTQAKELLEHGQWRNWIEENLDFGHDKADIMIKIYENYGSQQESLFGEVNVDTYRHLGVYQAFTLLKVPEEEREEFVKETHAEDLSVRELKKIIAEREAERDAAKKQLSAANSERDQLKAERDAAKAEQGKLEETEQELKKARMEKEAAEEATKVAQNNLGAVMEKEKEALAKYEAATKAAEEAEKNLAEAKKNPVISAEMLKTLQNEAEAKAKEAAETEIAKAKADAQIEIETLTKKLKASSGGTAKFDGAVNSLIASQEVVVTYFKNVKSESPETAEKLIMALQSVTDAFLKKIKA